MTPNYDRWKAGCRYVGYRLYQGFLMSSRLGEYNELLELLMSKSYICLTIREFASRVSRITRVSGDRIALLRHDVDSDVKTARAMFDLERKLGIQSSYYFRLNTIDISFMRELEAHGSEAGYHYEEIATFAKRTGIRTREGISARIGEVQQLFQANLRRLRETTGLPIQTIAAHGDFANRALRMTNYELLDASVRKNASIQAEAYDEALESRFTLRVSDFSPPLWWNPYDPRPHIRNGAQVVHLLLHPGQWRADPLINASQLCHRCIEGFTFWAKSRSLSTSIRSECEAGVQTRTGAPIR
jgi:hypothetical protein